MKLQLAKVKELEVYRFVMLCILVTPRVNNSSSRSSFATSFVMSVACCSSRLPAVADRFERNSLLLLVCFEVRLSSNTVKTNVFIRWLLTLFKSAKKYSVCSTHSFYTSLLTVGYSPYYYY